MAKRQIRLLALFIASLNSVLVAAPLVTLEDGRPAEPPPGIGIPIIATGGDFTIYWIGGQAGYISELYLDVLGNSVLFTNDGSPQASRTISGIPAGTELIFRMVVDGGRWTWYSGPASRNADNSVHAVVCNWMPDGVLNVSGTFVGFEDWPGNPADSRTSRENAGNGDFNDIMFVIHQEAIPEPGTLPLVSGALLTLGILRRRTLY